MATVHNFGTIYFIHFPCWHSLRSYPVVVSADEAAAAADEDQLYGSEHVPLSGGSGGEGLVDTEEEESAMGEDENDHHKRLVPRPSASRDDDLPQSGD